MPGHLFSFGAQSQDGSLAAVDRQLAVHDRPTDRLGNQPKRRPSNETRIAGCAVRARFRARSDDRPRSVRRPGRRVGQVTGDPSRAAGVVLPSRSDARPGSHPPAGSARDVERPARSRPEETRRRADPARHRHRRWAHRNCSYLRRRGLPRRDLWNRSWPPLAVRRLHRWPPLQMELP